jgi:tripartite-type tricarboxylate transporter receptor subunit TctC
MEVRETVMRIRFGHVVAIALGAIALTASFALPSQAQTWPQRPVKFVLPLGPGSGADLGARLLADRLTKLWGQTVVVENRPGADGVVAINTVLNAKDDHTLMFGPSSSFVAHPYLHDKMPYNQSDLLPVARFSVTLVGLAAPGSLNVKTLRDLFDLARAQPGKVNWATVTGVTDFLVAGFAKKAGLDMQKVPYRDTVQAQNDLAEGRIQMYIAALAIIRGAVQSGRIKLLAMTNRERAPIFPDVPTVAQAGFPDLEFDGLAGFFAARGIADAARARIAADVKAVSDDEVVKRLGATGQLVRPGNAMEFAQSIKEQADKVASFAQALGIKPKQ